MKERISVWNVPLWKNPKLCNWLPSSFYYRGKCERSRLMGAITVWRLDLAKESSSYYCASHLHPSHLSAFAICNDSSDDDLRHTHFAINLRLFSQTFDLKLSTTWIDFCKLSWMFNRLFYEIFSWEVSFIRVYELLQNLMPSGKIKEYTCLMLNLQYFPVKIRIQTATSKETFWFPPPFWIFCSLW